MKLIDLSHTVYNNMPVHPYDDEVSLYQDKFINTDKYANHILKTGMHAGTHIDAPMHLTDSRKFIGEELLDLFIGRGSIVDARNERVIEYKEEYSSKIKEKDIVLIYTSHDEKYQSEEYFTDHPVIDESLADFLIEKKIRMLGLDFPSPDNYPFLK